MNVIVLFSKKGDGGGSGVGSNPF